MADVPSFSRLGKLATKHQKVQAIIDTDYMGTRYKFTGPPRGDDEQQAEQDLCYIRAAAEGAQTRVEGLHAMQTAALQAPGQRGGSKVLIRLSENVR